MTLFLFNTAQILGYKIIFLYLVLNTQRWYLVAPHTEADSGGWRGPPCPPLSISGSAISWLAQGQDLTSFGEGNDHQILVHPVIKPSAKSCLARPLPQPHQPPCPLSVLSDWIIGDSPLCTVYIIPKNSTIFAYSNLNGPLLLPSLENINFEDQNKASLPFKDVTWTYTV